MSNDEQQGPAATAAPASPEQASPRDDDGERKPLAQVRSSPVVHDDGDAPASSSAPRDGFRRTDPSEVVTPKEAAASLNEALSLLKKASDPNMPWEDARRVLDVTGDALDVAGLALRAAEEGDGAGAVGGVHDGDDDDDDDDGGLGEVQWLSVMVSAARSRLLGGAYVDAKRKDPPPLPPGGTNDVPLIVWASQTGTAEEFASSLVYTLKNGGSNRGGKKKRIDVVDMMEAKLEDVVTRKRAYFVVSTFGIGRPPKKAEAFYASLQLYRGAATKGSGSKAGDARDGKESQGDFRPLAGTEVAVAALGDSRFKDFAAFGINLAQELQALGARPIIKVTTLDGKDGPEAQEAEFQNWEDLILRIENARSGDVGAMPQAGSRGASPQGREGGSSCCVIS
uniref:Flavodoxin-like domain-containing protein n=1 Tax=Odontella aurita TaxID=265563 RepID=A0A7S4JED3_9STRA|mmetsp:Transcript_44864/g.137025  ORF Transcript_44864/g.137025 Transcript_44864/m.137025 type:complete len:396 (+) Transcript_44864:181-1368(+)